MATDFGVTGAVATPLLDLDASKLASDFAPTTVTISDNNTSVVYTGVSLYTLITKANFQYPTTGVKNGFLHDYITVTGTDGETVVVSEGEVDPNFGGVNASMTDIVAYQRDGVAIAPTLIIPGDVNGSIGGRDIIDISSIVVGIADVPTPPPVTNPPPTVTLNGDVVAPGTVYTVADVQALPVASQTDTYLQGTTPRTFTFTGTPLISLLNSNGLTDGTPLDSYVVATGSDGYAVVYSIGEIDPTYRTGPLALVAYDDGTGTFPSISGGSGLFRTTAPFDSKGGRYVSNLETLAVSSALPCFAAGTRIATPGGETMVEGLRVGDLVLTIRGEQRPIRWIGRRHVDCRRHARPEQVWPIRIAAAAFGNGLPVRDLLLSPDHAVLVDDCLIPVKHLVNGLTILPVQCTDIEYFHVELDSHDVILAEGLPAESFLDTGQRSAFSNGGGPLALHPDSSARVWEAAGCAPLVVTGPILDAARERLTGQSLEAGRIRALP